MDNVYNAAKLLSASGGCIITGDNHGGTHRFSEGKARILEGQPTGFGGGRQPNDRCHAEAAAGI